MSPPFSIPAHIDRLAEAHRQKSGLLRFFEVNRQDFVDAAGLLCAELMASAYADRVRAMGFYSFCDLLMMALLAAPSQRRDMSFDRDGKALNVFGEAFLGYLPAGATLQDLYAPSNQQRFRREVDELHEFTWLITSRAFKSGIDGWGRQDVALATKRQQELLQGRRGLKPASRRFFG